jgi:hydrogenase nickel incorporation protein HypB
VKIRVIESVLKENDQVARANRVRMDSAGLLALNITSAPGSGKTTLLEKTMEALSVDYRCAVLVGDLQTARDAERLAGRAAEVIQINTGRGCHLSAAQVSEGLSGLTLDRIAYLFIENVGNMVCPAGFDLGEHTRVAMLSVPEGDDKVAKYPILFQAADLIVLNKIDLIGTLDFNEEQVRKDLELINTRAPFIRLSARTGEGMEEWLGWLKQRRASLVAKRDRG